jgi:hypothetical protein
MLAEAGQHTALLGHHRDWGFHQIPYQLKGLAAEPHRFEKTEKPAEVICKIRSRRGAALDRKELGDVAIVAMTAAAWPPR